MKIDTSKNFSKVVGSLKKAISLVRTLLNGNSPQGYTIGKYSRNRIAYAKNEQETFKWCYDGDSKTLTVTYTDGRPAPIEIAPKETYYIIWVEGIEARSGEKICTLSNTNHTYTLKMTKAMRVKSEHLNTVKEMLLNQGVASWALNENSFIKTHYAPKGTLYVP